MTLAKNILAAVLLACEAAPAQIITTIVGTDWSFPTGQLTAANAPLGGVFGAAVDAAGNVFIVDTNDSLILRVSLDGTLSVVAGNGIAGFSGDGGPATSASLYAPLRLSRWIPLATSTSPTYSQ